MRASNLISGVGAVLIAFFAYPADANDVGFFSRVFGEETPQRVHSPYNVNKYPTNAPRVFVYEIVNKNDPMQKKIICVEKFSSDPFYCFQESE